MNADPLINTHLMKRYRIINRIGSGGMGIVYRAFDRLRQREIALKRVFFSPHSWAATRGSDPAGSLAREFQILASLRHPNVINVLDYGFDEEQIPYLTMDLLRDARTIVEAGRVADMEGRIHMLTQTLLALSYLHRRGILHRDLKPSNVLVSADHTVKLVDFGLAQQEVYSEKVIGTLAYMAPEVLTDGIVSSASDLFGVGVMAYEIFAGAHPFPAAAPSVVIQQVLMAQPALQGLVHLPPKFKDVILRLLAKDPAQRFASAMDALEQMYAALDRPTPAEPIAYREDVLYTPAFAGRQQVMLNLKTAVQDSAREGGCTYLLSGVSGIGKSRVLEELRIYALARGIPVLVGGGQEVNSVTDAIWRDVLPALVLHVAPTDEEARALKPLVPALEQLIERTVEDASEHSYRRERELLAQAILGLFKRLDRPLLFFADDLQWVPDAELAILQELHKAAPELPLMIVGTYRSDEAPYLYGKFPLAQQIDLAPLQPGEIREVVSKMLGERDDMLAIVDFLAAHTEGNALFLVEVLRIMAENAGGIERIQGSQMPVELASQGVIRVLKQRLRHIRLDDQPMLRLAALLGREIDFDLLQVHDPEMDYEEWLVRAANASILSVHQGVWRFSHDKVREAVLDGLDESYLRNLHEKAAHALEAVYGNDTAYGGIIADHWRQAGRMDREVLYLSNIASMLTNQGRYDEAFALAQRGIDYYRAGGEVNPNNLFNLYIDVGDIHRNRGEFAQAHDAYVEARAIAEELNDPVLIGQSIGGLGSAVEQQGLFAQAAELLDQSIAIFREQNLLRQLSSAMTNRAVLAAKTADFATAKSYFEEVLAARKQLQDEVGLASVLTNLGNIAHIEREYLLAQDYYQQSLKITQAHRLDAVTVGTLNNLGMIRLELGDYAEAEAILQRARQTATAVSGHDRISVNSYYLGMVAFFRGQFTEADAYFEEVYQDNKQKDSFYQLIHVASAYAHIKAAQGKREETMRLMVETLHLVLEIGQPNFYELGLYSAVATALVLRADDLAVEWASCLRSFIAENDVRARHLQTRLLPELRERIGSVAYEQAEVRGKHLQMEELVQRLHAQFSASA